MFNFNIKRIGQSPNADWMRFAYHDDGSMTTLISRDGIFWETFGKARKPRRLTPA